MEEQKTLAAFRTLLSLHRFFGVPDDETLVPMLAESASTQQEVTDQLGSQVRSAVEILIQSLDRADQDYGRELLADVPEVVLDMLSSLSCLRYAAYRNPTKSDNKSDEQSDNALPHQFLDR